MTVVPRSTWARTSFGEVVTLINGRAYKQHEMLSSGTPILRIQNLNGGDNWFYSNLQLPHDKYCERGDLLYAWSATFGPYVYNGPRAIFHYHIWNVKPTAVIDQKFVFYELLRITDAIKTAAHGVAMPHITKAGMEAWPLDLPPLAEQQRIVAKLNTLLSRVDGCRERLERVGPLIKRFRHSVLHAATTGQLTVEWRDRRHSAPWKGVTLGDVAIDVRYGTSKKCDYPTRGVGVLRIPNIGTNGVIDRTDLKFAEFEAGEIESLTLRAGDLLVIRSNGSLELVGRTAVVDGDSAGLLYAGYLIRLRLDQELVDPRFAYFCLTSPITRQVLTSSAKSTSGVNNLNAGELRALPISLPCMEEQREIVRRAGRLLERAAALERHLADAQRVADRLTPATLAKAFRGELVPQDPNDEPAEVLLARIRAEREVAGAAAPRRRRGAGARA